MSTKSSEVIVALYRDSFNGDHGTFYNYDIIMKNGDDGIYTSTTKNQDRFIVGKETEYTISRFNGKVKIKPIYGLQKEKNESNKIIELLQDIQSKLYDQEYLISEIRKDIKGLKNLKQPVVNLT